jgi:hypothetical protein
MPTGYTSRIKDGITFEQFIMSCARAFGALVTMRDDSSDAVIPDKFEPSDYYIKGLKKANAELSKFKALNEDDYKLNANVEYVESLNEYERSKKEHIDLYNAYDSMLIQVESWNPPSNDHVELKNFMIQQIRDSIKFDCYEIDIPVLKTGVQWANERLKSILWDINYHTEYNREEIQRVDDRNKWIRQLRESIKTTA